MRKAWWAFAILLLSGAARAEIESRGELAVESRAFRGDGDAGTHDRALGLFGRLEWRHQHAPFEEKVRGYGRLDHFDRQRSTAVLEEAWVQVRRGRLRLRVGADLVNWTATEAFHPADVINARNLDSDLENLEKVGEPMAALHAGAWEGMTASLLFMPARMHTRFPSAASRLGFAPGVELGRRRAVVDRDGRFSDSDLGPQAALRLQQVLGAADVSVHAIEQVDRLQPVVALDGADGAVLPVFLTVRQVGGTYQQVFGGLILKVEAAYRWFRAPLDGTDGLFAPDGSPARFTGRDHGRVAVGLEYGLAHRGGAESNLFLEAQVVLGPDPATRRQLDPFQRDLFAGYRLALGDEDGKELFLGAIVDLETRDQLLASVSYQQRLGETFSLRAAVRLFAAPAGAGGLGAFRNADHVRLTLTRHF